MNPVPREIEYDYDQMTQDFKSAKKEAPIKPIKVAEGVYKKPVGKTSRRYMFVRITSALPQLQRQNIRGPFPYPIHTLSYPYIHILSLRSSYALPIQLGYICTFYFSQ